MMKHLFVLPLLALALHLQAQTLFTYGKYKVSTEEFLNAYNKNKLPSDTGKEAVNEYLQLYINYKLKVQDAIDNRLDTLPAQRADLQSFRHQIEQNYLYDHKELARLIDEAGQRIRKDIRVSLWSVKPAVQLSNQVLKTLSAEVFKEIQKNADADLSSIEKKGVIVTRENMGFVTAFTLPYHIENIIYGLGSGTCSSPILFNGNYLIFRNDEERPAAGRIRVAQILVAPPSGDTAQQEKMAALADSLYDVLMNGGDFSALAKQFSNDRKTYFNGGEMPEFGVGKYSPEFEEQAFSLRFPGAISRPFKTAFGFHILKLIAATPVSSVAPDNLYGAVREKVLGDSRVDLARNKLMESARSYTGFRRGKLPTAAVYKVTDSVIISGHEITSEGVSSKSVLFGFNDHSEITLSDWISYVKSSGELINSRLHESFDKLMAEFESRVVLENYKKRLETFDKDFSGQMKEFAEGNMLFEMTQRKVWAKASQDTLGQKNYFELHRNRYQWHKSVDAVIFSCNNEETARQAAIELRNKSWRKVLELNPFDIQADSGRYEIDQLPLAKAPAAAGLTEPLSDKFDNTTTFVQVIKLYPDDAPRDFLDSKGLVIEDYQKQLEEAWIAELKSRYPVIVNKKIFAVISKQAAIRQTDR